MPAISHCSDVFASCQDLYQFLLTCQRRGESSARSLPQCVSISTPLDGLDPLVALHHFLEPNQPYFYLENARRGEAIAAVGSVLSHPGRRESAQRFTQAKRFWASCLARTQQQGDTTHPFSGPHLFGAFTFFEQVQVDSPFAPATLVLPKWHVARYGDRSTVVMNVAVPPGPDPRPLAESLWQHWQTLRQLRYLALPPSTTKLFEVLPPHLVATPQFRRSVQAMVQAIQSHQLQKAVLAHAVDIQSAQIIQLAESLAQLRQRYPACSVFAIGNAHGQSFMGASPERLMSIRQHEFMTDALAGSAPRGRSPAIDQHYAQQLYNSAKERHEHDIVVQFIKQQLQALGLQPLSTTQPGLLKLSTIQHLHTPIRAKLPAQVHPFDIVAALHPTPAVAGVPRHLACAEIQQHEPFERSLYAAPIGWIDHQGNCEFVVGIRSALVQGDRARLFAGAGIVAGSDPDRELAEVQLKLRVLLADLV